MTRSTPHAHWYQVRNSIVAALGVSIAVGIWSWTSNVVAELHGLRVSVDDMRHEASGVDGKRNREIDILQSAILRELGFENQRILALEACACRS